MPADREIEGLDQPLAAKGKPSRWEQFRLPVELAGRSFCDVGCWEGVHCAEAVRRDAADVVGVDLCSSPHLARNVERYGFDFVQMDVFAERWLELGDFDVVLCSGLLYSVESPTALLARLRAATRELLVLETGFTTHGEGMPMMLFHGGGEGTGNPSNWWTPNKPCLTQMLECAGFEGIATVWEEERHEGYGRVCVHAVPRGWPDRERLLPRKAKLMPIAGGRGNRRVRSGGERSNGAENPPEPTS